MHSRPAAFEGPDGCSYSIEIMASPSRGAEITWEAFLLFVKWARVGAASPEGHLESDVLAEADTEADARAIVGTLTLAQVRQVLFDLIAVRSSAAPPGRKWYDVMRDTSMQND